MMIKRKLVFEFDADDQENIGNTIALLEGILRSCQDIEEKEYIQETAKRLTNILYNKIPTK